MAINKVEYGGNTLIDITDTTATESDVVSGKTFYAANGTRQTGSYTETDPIFSASAASGITSSDITNWNNKSTFSGDYDDLTNKPTIPTVNNGKLQFSKDGVKVTEFTANSSTNVNVDLTNEVKDVQINGTSILSSGNADIKTYSTYNASTNKIATMSDIPTVPEVGNAKIYYGTSDTAESTITKIVTCSGFVLETGATISVKFTNAHNSSSAPYLNINDTGSKKVVHKSGTSGLGYDWQDNEMVQFVYDGTNYVEVDGAIATTTYYGLTKLSNAINSNTNHSATPYAVKQAYDLADSKQDELVSGTNIKTINGDSLLGSGDITISGGGTDTGWITITPTNGTAGTGYYVPQYRKIGKLVTMRGYITVKNNTAMFTLPEAYRPSARLTFAGTNDDKNVNEIRIVDTGDVRLLGTTGTFSRGVDCFLDNISYFVD